MRIHECHNEMATSFDFPKYSVEQLVEAFRSELGAEFDIRPDDFANPVRERWIKMFCSLLAHMTESDVDEMINRLRSTDLEFFDYSDLYSESQLLFNLAKFMAHMLTFCKVHDFTADDIVNANSKRLVMIMSAILNYIRFRVNRKQEVMQIIEKMESKAAKLSALKKENENYKEKIEELRKMKAEKAEAVARVVGQVESSTMRLDQLRKIIKDLNQEVTNLKLSINKKKLDSQKRKERVSRLATEIAEAEEQIVQSPDRFQAEIRDLEAKLERMDAVLREKEDCENKLRKLFNPEKMFEFSKALKEIQAVKDKDKTIRQLTIELARIRDEIRDLEEKASGIKKENGKLHTQIVSKQEKFDRRTVVFVREEEEKELQLQQQLGGEVEKKKLLIEKSRIKDRRLALQQRSSDLITENDEAKALLREVYSRTLTEIENYNRCNLDRNYEAVDTM